jgi:hypothetical protein
MFELTDIRWPKGKSSQTVLKAEVRDDTFNVIRFPDPLVRLRSGKRRIFGFNKITSKGTIYPHTSSCALILELKDFK